MLRLTPPAHSVDDAPMWIAPGDMAWDHERVDAERTRLGEDTSGHPFHVYYSAATRYSLEAHLNVPDALRSSDGPSTVTIEDYILPGKTPTRFELRSLGGRDWAIAQKLLDTQGTFEFVRRGLVRVHDAEGHDGKPTTIDPPRDRDGGISEEWLDVVSTADRQLLQRLGAAVLKLSLSEAGRAEGKL